MKSKRLMDLQMPAKLRIELSFEGLPPTMYDCVCHHLDGMYSYCYIEAMPEKIFHLSCGTPMKEVDGRWEIDDE